MRYFHGKTVKLAIELHSIQLDPKSQPGITFSGEIFTVLPKFISLVTEHYRKSDSRICFLPLVANTSAVIALRLERKLGFS